MDNLIEIACESLNNGDVPIGAIIKKNDEVIAVSYNTREKEQNVLGHAEINAIVEAQKKLKNWNLNGCELYVTLKPCSMCLEVIKQARIDKVYYLLDKPRFKKDYDKTVLEKIDNFEEEKQYVQILSDFFQKIREK